MKKIRIAVVIMLFAVLLASCTNQNQPPVLITGQQQVIRNVDELKAKLGSASSGSYKIDVAVSTSDIPITINGNKDIKGSIFVIDEATSSLSLEVAQAGKNIFKVADDASVSISGLTATIPAGAAAKVASVVYVNTGKLDARSITVVTDSTSTETTVSAVAVGADTTLDNFNIGNINGSVYIPAKNTNDALKEKVEESSSGIVSDVDAGNDDFSSVLAEMKAVRLTEDVSVDSLPLVAGSEGALAEYAIDLNGHTLTIATAASVIIPNYCSLDIDGEGTLVVKGNKGDEWGTNGVIGLLEGSVLNLSDLTYNSNSSSIALGSNEEGKNAKSATLEIINCTIYSEGAYVVGSNASAKDSEPYTRDINVTIKGSTLTAGNKKDNDNTAVLFNVPGTLTIEGSTLNADRQALIVRGGNATIKDSTLHSTGDFSGSEVGISSWDSGNNLPLSALVVGNKNSTAYNYKTTCVLEDVNITMDNQEDTYDIVVSSCNGKSVTLTTSQYADNFTNKETSRYYTDSETTTVIQKSEV